MFTFRPNENALSPIASGILADRGRLSPDGLTAYSFRRPAGQDVYQLVASRQLGAETVLLQFPGAGETSIPVGLALDRSGTRVAMLEISIVSPLYEARLRVHRLGTADWTEVATFLDVGGGLDWHPDGRRLLTSTYDRVAGKPGRLAIIDIEAKTLTPIGPVTDQAISEAVFAKDGRSVVYSRLNADDMTELVSIGFDGGRATSLPPHIDGIMPTFSPDGRYLAYCGRYQVGTNWLLGRFLRRLSDGATEQILPPSLVDNFDCIQDWAR